MKPTRTSAQQQATIIEQLFDAVVAGDPEKVLRLLHSKVEWTPTVWSGESMYRGHEGVHLWLSQFGESLEYLDVRVQRSQSMGDRGVVLGIVFDTRGDQKFAVKVAWSYELEEGLLRRGCAHDTWEEALEAVGLPDAPSTPAAPTAEPKVGRALGRVRQALRPNPDCPVGRHLRRFSRH